MKRILLISFFVWELSLASTVDSCWNQRSTADVKDLFHYCNFVLAAPHYDLESKVRDFDQRLPVDSLCQVIKYDQSFASNNPVALGFFNECMSLNPSSLTYFQLQKVYDCVSLLGSESVISSVLDITKRHFVDKKIFRGVGDLIGRLKTPETRNDINKFNDCLGYIDDLHLEFPNRT